MLALRQCVWKKDKTPCIFERKFSFHSWFLCFHFLFLEFGGNVFLKSSRNRSEETGHKKTENIFDVFKIGRFRAVSKTSFEKLSANMTLE